MRETFTIPLRILYGAVQSLYGVCAIPLRNLCKSVTEPFYGISTEHLRYLKFLQILYGAFAQQLRDHCGACIDPLEGRCGTLTEH